MTRSDDLQSLSVQQEKAVRLLVTGLSITQVAKELNIARQTLSTWKNHDCVFQDALNQRRREMLDGCSDKIRSKLLPKALNVLLYELDRMDGLKAAIAILKLVDVNKLLTIGSSNPNGVELGVKNKDREMVFDGMGLISEESKSNSLESQTTLE